MIDKNLLNMIKSQLNMKKQAFVPPGMPPMDPAMVGGGGMPPMPPGGGGMPPMPPGGGGGMPPMPPMDPAMMGGGGMPPMPPGGGGMPPIDPAILSQMQEILNPAATQGGEPDKGNEDISEMQSRISGIEGSLDVITSKLDNLLGAIGMGQQQQVPGGQQMPEIPEMPMMPPEKQGRDKNSLKRAMNYLMSQ